MTRLRLFSIMIVLVVSAVVFAGIARPQTALQRAQCCGKRGEFFGTEPDLPQFVHEVYADPPGAP